jgi:hypothetical protein
LPGRRAPQAVIRKGAVPVAQSGIAREAGPGFRKCSIRAADIIQFSNSRAVTASASEAIQLSGQDAKDIDSSRVYGEAEYFFEEGWTR